VNAETTRYLELLEQRIVLLGSLSQAFLAARTDVVAFDLDGLETRIADQERLCVEIRSLDTSVDRLRLQCAAQLGASPDRPATETPNRDNRRLRETLDRLHTAQVRVKQQNDAHQILLRRSRRTVSALLNSYHSFALTYSDPCSIRASAGESL
jgi:hypothetical protein